MAYWPHSTHIIDLEIANGNDRGNILQGWAVGIGILDRFKIPGSGDCRPFSSTLMEGVELALKKPRYPAPADMNAKWQRKER